MIRRNLVLPILLLAPLPAMAQEREAPPTCDAAGFHAFDFWIGEWTVTDPAGAVAGSNVITSVSDGCALLEEWRSADGNTGTSLNHYDARTGRWYQRWVGAGQSILHLEGGLEDGSMVLSGERTARAGGSIIDRIRWTPQADGSVRQHWQYSTDGGTTWSEAFDGTYRRTTPKPGGAGP